VEIAIFTFNDFKENTYLLYDDTGECMIVDPGMNNDIEKIQFDEFIVARGLTPKVLFNTHCHVDHVLGNQHIADKYGLKLMAHKGEQIVLDFVPDMCRMYGIPYTGSPDIELFVEEGEYVKFGNQKLKALFTPGHSPASLSLYNAEANILIAGDVLFQNSIGRTDLPGGDYDTLIKMVREKIFVLPDETLVYPGHGPSTTVGIEKKSNPFFE
jgi:glyoxylase-like metal-dependent hydrolase (beta-lactamase superfamily II)